MSHHDDGLPANDRVGQMGDLRLLRGKTRVYTVAPMAAEQMNMAGWQSRMNVLMESEHSLARVDPVLSVLARTYWGVVKS